VTTCVSDCHKSDTGPVIDLMCGTGTTSKQVQWIWSWNFNADKTKYRATKFLPLPTDTYHWCMKESSEQTLWTEVVLGMDPSEARLLLDSRLASLLIKVSFLCKSRIYSACNISQKNLFKRGYWRDNKYSLRRWQENANRILSNTTILIYNLETLTILSRHDHK
jgi:hypothetical protein